MPKYSACSIRRAGPTLAVSGAQQSKAARDIRCHSLECENYLHRSHCSGRAGNSQAIQSFSLPAVAPIDIGNANKINGKSGELVIRKSAWHQSHRI
jgi:hypothetical protein